MYKYRLRFRFAVRGSKKKIKGDGWKEEGEEGVAQRKRSGTEGEGGVIFVVGATKRETEK